MQCRLFLCRDSRGSCVHGFVFLRSILFYTLNGILFSIIYGMIALMMGYLSVFGAPVQAGILSIMLFVTLAVQLSVNRIFLQPSKTLSLVKAVVSDESVPLSVKKQRKYEAYLQAKTDWEKMETKHSAGFDDDGIGTETTMPNKDSSESETRNGSSSSGGGESTQIREAVTRLQGRYRAVLGDDDRLSDLTTSDKLTGPRSDFFIYRQPALNRATWESQPRSYRRELAKRRFDGHGEADIGVDFWEPKSTLFSGL